MRIGCRKNDLQQLKQVHRDDSFSIPQWHPNQLPPVLLCVKVATHPTHRSFAIETHAFVPADFLLTSLILQTTLSSSHLPLSLSKQQSPYHVLLLLPESSVHWDLSISECFHWLKKQITSGQGNTPTCQQ